MVLAIVLPLLFAAKRESVDVLYSMHFLCKHYEISSQPRFMQLLPSAWMESVESMSLSQSCRGASRIADAHPLQSRVIHHNRPIHQMAAWTVVTSPSLIVSLIAWSPPPPPPPRQYSELDAVYVPLLESEHLFLATQEDLGDFRWLVFFDPAQA